MVSTFEKSLCPDNNLCIPDIIIYFHKKLKFVPGEKQIDKKTESSQLDLWGNTQDFHWKEFKVAREYIRSLKLKNKSGWKKFVNSRNLQGTNIPVNPDKVYINHGWKDWKDWLGVEETREKSLIQSSDNNVMDSLWSTDDRSKWMNFFEARQIVRKYGFEYKEEWELFLDGKFHSRETIPDNIPRNPDQIYRFVGWKDWKDWLIHPDKQIEYSEFNQAREFVRSNRIPDKKFWRDFLQQNAGLIKKYQLTLPVRPYIEYKETGWQSWEDWTGSEISCHDFESTRKYVRSLKLKNKQEWNEFCHGRLIHKPKKAENIYAYPEIAFRDEGWSGWEDWLGTVKKKEIKHPSPEPTEITIECKCKGRIKDCPHCDGKGYYTVNYT